MMETLLRGFLYDVCNVRMCVCVKMCVCVCQDVCMHEHVFVLHVYVSACVHVRMLA